MVILTTLCGIATFLLIIGLILDCTCGYGIYQDQLKALSEFKDFSIELDGVTLGKVKDFDLSTLHIFKYDVVVNGNEETIHLIREDSK